MMKAYIICLALCSVTHAVYYNQMPVNRMTTVNRIRTPTLFRPGISLQSLQSVQRPWSFGTMKLTQAASHRSPYILLKNQPQRFAIKHYVPSGTRNMFTHSPWKSTVRLPTITPLTEYMQAASGHTTGHSDGGTGAIHTIPAPNLSLSEKPIVVLDTSENPVSEKSKPSYEVTEKYSDNEYTMAKIEPIGFSKSTSFTTPELHNLIRSGAVQVASEYSLPTLNQHHPLMPQQFQLQNLNNFPSQQEFINTGTDGFFISPNTLYQSNPMFLPKFQNQLVQRFPPAEFVPYAADITNQDRLQYQTQASHSHPQIVLNINEQLNRPLKVHFPEQNEQKHVVQRETPEHPIVNLIPKAFSSPNTTAKEIKVTTPQQNKNITVELVASESKPVTTTIKYVVETNTKEQNSTPIYYAQVGQSVGNVIANGFYSAINDVRAAAALAQLEKAPVTTTEKTSQEVTTTTTPIPNLEGYFIKSEDKTENKTTEIKPFLAVPFKKATDSVNVAYTLVRADSDDKQPKVNQEGTVYAGQIIEASVSEDQDFNNEKASLVSKRAPIRLLAITDTNDIDTTSNTSLKEKVTVVKAKIPVKSKLIFDDETGEPILRIYASYASDENAPQKDFVVAKLSTLKPAKDSVINRDLTESWKGTTVKSTQKSQGFDDNPVTQFGLKLKQRTDDYVPLFEDYED